MKSFFKFIGFLISWYIVYRVVSAISNWVMDKLSDAVNISSFIGQLIICGAVCFIVWNGLFFPLLLIGKMLLDKVVYCAISMILIGILCLVSFFSFTGSWILVVVNVVHAAANLLPLFMVLITVKNESDEAKKMAEEEYRQNLKSEIIQELNEHN